METKKVTVAEVLEAIEKNGYKHIRGQWWGTEWNDGPAVITSACVMGQAALNLGVSNSDLESKLNAAADGLASTMINYNDDELPSGRHRKYSELKEIARNKFRPHLHKMIEVETAEYNAVRKG